MGSFHDCLQLTILQYINYSQTLLILWRKMIHAINKCFLASMYKPTSEMRWRLGLCRGPRWDSLSAPRHPNFCPSRWWIVSRWLKISRDVGLET